MNRLVVTIVAAAILLTAATGCVRVTTLEVTRERDFDRAEALAIHLEAFEPVYQFILDFYPREGPRDERFKTRADVVNYLSETLPKNVAGEVAAFFLGEQAEAFNVAYDVFFPTPFHSGVELADAFIERVVWPGMGKVDLYLVVVDRFVAELADIQRPRETCYTQDGSGIWRLHSISGTIVVQGTMYSPYGFKK